MEIQNGWYRVSIKALVYDSEGRFMLCKESNGMRDLPWGGLDHREDPFVSLKRELQEELGLEALSIESTPKYFLTAHKPTSKTRPWIANVCYETTLKHFEFTPSDECVEIWFFHPEDILNMNVLPNVSVLGEMMKKN